MVTPELRWPTTPATLASTSFCATVVPTFGSAWSSSATKVNLTGLPSILMPAALASSTARRAPFSLSLPRCAMPPVSGPTWPILTSRPPAAAGAGAAAPLSALAAGFCSPQPIRAIAAAKSVMLEILFMEFSRGVDIWGRYFTADLLLRHDPFHEGLDVGVRHGSVGGHRHLAPDPRPALLNLVEQLRLGALVGAVLRRDVLVGRPDKLLVDRVAGKAGVLLGELLARIGGQRSDSAGDAQNQNKCD